MRVGHLAFFAADLNDTLADVRLQGGTVVLDDVPCGAVADYLELPAGTYDLKITTADGAATLLDLMPVDLTDGAILSVFAVGDLGNQPAGAFALPSGAEGTLLPVIGRVNLIAAMDTYVSVRAPNMSYGNAINFKVRQSNVMRALAQFDLSSIPEYADVQEAMLKLYTTYRTNGNALNLSAYQVLGAWDGSVTWNTVPAADDTALAMIRLDGVGGQVMLDVTDMAQSWMSGEASNCGLMLSAADTKRVEHMFLAPEFSQESAGPPYPLLQVTYISTKQIVGLE